MQSDYKISNIIGTQLSPWVIEQLNTRSEKGSVTVRDNQNLVYNANKTAWIRLVSSVNTPNQADRRYFTDLGIGNMQDDSSLAKEFILFGGTSFYLGKKTGISSYQLREGFKPTYSILGEQEVNKFGYRPMPGITSVTIETQGKLGSVRQAVVNFKCWDKSQLDIMDALYFKLGFTMFLEWGHTYYYSSKDPSKLQTTEQYALDPFSSDLTKEQISRHISKNSRESEGNYDAMLGIVTNFNFSYNQEGGFDCMVRIMSLGVLGDSIKINHSKVLQNILEERIKEYSDILSVNLNSFEDIKNTKEKEILTISTDQKFINSIKNTQKDKQNLIYVISSSDKEQSNFILNNDEFGKFIYLDRIKKLLPIETDLSNISISFNQDTTNKLFKELLNKYLYQQFSTNSWELEKGDISNRLGYALTKQYLNEKVEFKIWRDDKPQLSANPISESVKNSIKLILSQKRLFPKSEYSYQPNQFVDIKNLNNTIVINENNKPTPSGFLSNDLAFKTIGNLFADNIKSKEKYFKIVKIENKGIVQQRSSLAVQNIQVNKYAFTVKIDLPIKLYTKVTVSNIVDEVGKNQKNQVFDALLDFNVESYFTFEDTALIEDIQTPNFVQPQLVPPSKNLEEPAPFQEAGSNQTDSPLKNLSSLELVLRTIQVRSLTEAIIRSGKKADINRQTIPIDLTELDSPYYENFVDQIFSNGVFSKRIRDLIAYPSITENEYNIANEEEKFFIHAKYGFATNFIAGKAPITEFSEVDFKKLLTTYVVPYEINQSLEDGTPLNHPVYIPFGQLLMLLNHNCTIYDTGGKVQTPLIYIDFNPNHNYCLSSPKHLSTNPFKVLIPFEGNNEDFYALFDKEVKVKEKNDKNITIVNDTIMPVSGSDKSTPIFNVEQNDYLSGAILNFKYDSDPQTEQLFSPYRGKIMNILLNIDYLMGVLKESASKNDQNKIFLKSTLEQILSDINKSLGNYNIFRLSYNDAGNVFQIIDDSIIPVNDTGERQLLKTNSSLLPLFGLKSIAKNLEIKTDISTKLASMLAISANKDLPSKSALSSDGTSFGFINYDFVDRYISKRTESTGSNSSISDAAIKSAIQFNSAIKSFYSTVNPSENQIGFATNYYIERMTQIKGNDPATRSSAMIPVSINFTTDGISGMNMYQSFTVPENLLPYTYTSARTVSGEKDLNKVGFVIVGLSHTIQDNVWNTSVRANMIFLKGSEDYRIEKEINRSEIGIFTKEETTVDPSIYQVSPPIEDVKGRRGVLNAAFKEPGFKEALERTAKNIGAKYEDLLGVMRAESGVDPKAINPLGGASGLIQFMPATAEGLGTSIEEIRKMTAIKQLEYVEKYYKTANAITAKRATKDKYGLYAYTFLPAMVKHLDNDQFKLEFGSLSGPVISKYNPGIARAAGKNPGDVLTVGDFKKYVSKVISA